MSSLNKVQIIGRLGSDPELAYFKSGDAYVNFSVASSEKWKDKQTGEKREETEWHRMFCSGKAAEVICNYLKKGSLAYFEGKLKTRKWTDNSGVERYTTEIIVKEFQFLESAGDKGQGGGQQQAQQPRQAAAPAQQRSAPAQAPRQAPAMDAFDDDIPF
jgi:single-strand DNA-binding protein